MKKASRQNRKPICFHLAILIVVIGLCSGCSEQYTAKPPEKYGQWFLEFVNSPACQAPCWANITPGKTTMAEAMQIVKSRKDVIKFQDPILPPPSGNDIDFLWSFKDDNSGGWISSDASGEYVARIIFDVSGSFGISLKMFAEKFGDPDQILVYASLQTQVKNIELVYSKYMMKLVTNARVSNGKIQISPDTVSTRIEIFTKELFQRHLKELFGDKNMDDLSKWHGYGEYQPLDP